MRKRKRACWHVGSTEPAGRYGYNPKKSAIKILRLPKYLYLRAIEIFCYHVACSEHAIRNAVETLKHELRERYEV